MDQIAAIRVFVRIAEGGSFSRAADLLNLPKPSATRMIQELEAHLGIKLLQRSTRRVAVTPEGAAYYERAVRLISDLDEMDAEASNSRAKPRGKLRIDIGSSPANLILIPALPSFLQQYPDVALDLGVSDRPTDLISEGVDCVIRGGALPDSSMMSRVIARLDYVTCASPAYLQRHGIPMHPDELDKGHVPIHYFSSLTGRPFPMLFQRNEEFIEVAKPAAISVNESTAHLSSLLTGLGVSQTFRFMAQPHIDLGNLVPVLTEWSRPRHDLHIMYPPTRHLSAKLRVFVDWTVEVFKDYSARLR